MTEVSGFGIADSPAFRGRKAQMFPQLTAAQLNKLIAAYEQGVTALKNQGYLTAAQASTLDTLAGDVNS